MVMYVKGQACDIQNILKGLHVLYNQIYSVHFDMHVATILTYVKTMSISELEREHLLSLLGIPQRESSINLTKLINKNIVVQCINMLTSAEVSLRTSNIERRGTDSLPYIRFLEKHIGAIAQKYNLTIHNKLSLTRLMCDCLGLNASVCAEVVYADGKIPYAYLVDFETDKNVRIMPNGMDTTVTPWQALHGTSKCVRMGVTMGDCSIVYDTNYGVNILGAKATRYNNLNDLWQSDVQMSQETLNTMQGYATVCNKYNELLNYVAVHMQWYVEDLIDLAPYAMLEIKQMRKTMWLRAVELLNRGIDRDTQVTAVAIYANIAHTSNAFMRYVCKTKVFEKNKFEVVSNTAVSTDVIATYLHDIFLSAKRQENTVKQSVYTFVLNRIADQKQWNVEDFLILTPFVKLCVSQQGMLTWCSAVGLENIGISAYDTITCIALRLDIAQQSEAIIKYATCDTQVFENTKYVVIDSAIRTDDITSYFRKIGYDNDIVSEIISKFSDTELNNFSGSELKAYISYLYIKIRHEYVSLTTVLSDIDNYVAIHALDCCNVYVLNRNTKEYIPINDCVYNFSALQKSHDYKMLRKGTRVSVLKNKRTNNKSNIESKSQKPRTLAETEILEKTTEEPIGFVCQPVNSENKKSNVNTPLDVLRKLFQ